jgi:hypothetical protein
MDLDVLANQDKMSFTEILSSLEKSLSAFSFYASDIKTSDQLRDIARKWYLRGYMKALDDYKTLIG